MKIPIRSIRDSELVQELEKQEDYQLKRLSRPAIEAFFNIAKLWGLSSEEKKALLGIYNTEGEDKEMEKLSYEILDPKVFERISYILGIFKYINNLLPNNQAADEWVKKPNQCKLFEGKTALQYMMKSLENIRKTKQYLASQMRS